MNKLTLNVEDLAVESFATAPEKDGRGTVRAHADTWINSCPQSCDWTCNTRNDGTCPTGFTCHESCGGTCDAGCNPGTGIACPQPTFNVATCPPDCWD